MRMIVWLLTIAFALAGIAFREQGGIPHAHEAGVALLILAGIACPFFWAKGEGLLAWTGVTGKDRLMLTIAMLLSVPLWLPWPFWL